MSSAIIVSGTGSVRAMALAAAVLAFLVNRVVLQVTMAADGSTTAARGFLLGGSA